MEIIQVKQDMQGTRTLGVGGMKFVQESWMQQKVVEASQSSSKKGISNK